MDANASVPSTVAVGASHDDTRVALREYLLSLMAAMQRENDLRFVAMERATLSALSSAQAAVSKAESSVDKRLEAMNEFRKALNDLTIMLMPRTEALGRLDQLDRLMTELKSKIDRTEGKTAVVDPAFAALADEVRKMRLDQTMGAGKSAGSAWLWALILGAAGFVAALLSIASRFGGTP